MDESTFAEAKEHRPEQERMIPLHEEAAAAIREIQALCGTGDRGLRDSQTGVETRYLFLHLRTIFCPSTI
jgi:hypothetical protein